MCETHIGNVTINCGTCVVCGIQSTLEVDTFEWIRYAQDDLLVQDAFPDLSKEDRELLVTGTHSKCFDALTFQEEVDGTIKPKDVFPYDFDDSSIHYR